MSFALRACLGASLLVGVAWTATAPSGGAAPDAAPTRPKPLAEQTIAMKPYEHSSQSPHGGFRIGGSDERRVIFSPDGKYLASEDAGCWQLQRWDVATGKELDKFGETSSPVALAYSADGKSLVSADATGRVQLWDVLQGKLLRGLDEDVNSTPFSAVAFTADGKRLALVGQAGGRRGPAGHTEIHIWDVASGDELRRFSGPPAEGWTRRGGSVALAFSPDGRCLALATGDTIHVWELASERLRCLLGPLPPALNADQRSLHNVIAGLAFSREGRFLVAAAADAAIHCWDLQTGQRLPPLLGHSGGARAVCFVPEGKTLLSFGWDNKVLTWGLPLPRPWTPGAEALPEATLAALWKDLGGDPHVSYVASRLLATHPKQALPLLQKELRPVPPMDSQRIAGLVADLENDSFNVRKKAAKEIRQLGVLAVPALREANDKRYSELLRRWLANMESQGVDPEELRRARAVGVLEDLATPEARGLLEKLAKGAAEAPVTQLAKGALDRVGAAPAAAARTPEELWPDLAADDAVKAFRAMRGLVAAPDKALPVLRERLRPLAAVIAFDDDPRRIATLIADLDSADFKTRQQATAELKKLGRRAIPYLEKALVAGPSLEMRGRIDAIMAQADRPTFSPERLQASRAIELLEWLATPEARQVLEDTAGQAKNTEIKEEIARVVARWPRQ